MSLSGIKSKELLKMCKRYLLLGFLVVACGLSNLFADSFSFDRPLLGKHEKIIINSDYAWSVSNSNSYPNDAISILKPNKKWEYAAAGEWILSDTVSAHLDTKSDVKHLEYLAIKQAQETALYSVEENKK